MLIPLLISCTTEKIDTALQEVTYYQDVAPIITNNCLSCHREDGSAPFALDSYETVRALGPSIVDSITQRRMPPFHADNSGECQDFVHSPWLASEDIETITSWVE